MNSIVGSFGRLLPVIAIAGGLMLASAPAKAEVKILVGYAPGGPADLAARLVQETVTPFVSEPWTIINRPGGNSHIALEEVMNANPDGKTLMVNGSTWMQDKFIGGTRPDPDRFDYVAVLSSSPYAIYVSADSPWQTLDELIEYSKANPGELRYATIGNEGGALVRYQLYREATGIEWTLVPFPSEADVMTALLGGNIDVASGGLGPVIGQAEGGLVRILGVSGDERLADLPDIPTSVEQGYPLLTHNMRIVMAPKGISPEVRQELEGILSQAAATPQFDELVRNLGDTPNFAVGERAQALIEQQLQFFESTADLFMAAAAN